MGQLEHLLAAAFFSVAVTFGKRREGGFRVERSGFAGGRLGEAQGLEGFV